MSKTVSKPTQLMDTLTQLEASMLKKYSYAYGMGSLSGLIRAMSWELTDAQLDKFTRMLERNIADLEAHPQSSL